MRIRILSVMAMMITLMAACSAKSTAPDTNTSGSGGNTGNTGGTGGTGGSGTLTVASSGASNGTLPTTYTCDGGSQSPPISWSGAPTGTTGYAMIMTTIPGPGTVKYNWILYNIPPTATSIAAGATGVGTAGFADDGGGLAYAPPCSQGPGLKNYIFTIYALSGTPSLTGLSANQVTGAVLTAALAPVTLASATLTLGVNRTQAMINCASLRTSLGSYSTTNSLAITCDSTYGYFSTYGIQMKHAMMNGITATNQQVPIAQNFTGTIDEVLAAIDANPLQVSPGYIAAAQYAAGSNPYAGSAQCKSPLGQLGTSGSKPTTAPTAASANLAAAGARFRGVRNRTAWHPSPAIRSNLEAPPPGPLTMALMVPAVKLAAAAVLKSFQRK